MVVENELIEITRTLPVLCETARPRLRWLCWKHGRKLSIWLIWLKNCNNLTTNVKVIDNFIVAYLPCTISNLCNSQKPTIPQDVLEHKESGYYCAKLQKWFALFDLKNNPDVIVSGFVPYFVRVDHICTKFSKWLRKHLVLFIDIRLIDIFRCCFDVVV